jgi:TetR/AcrR family transcriptional regulator, regulator of mycofactocin system
MASLRERKRDRSRDAFVRAALDLFESKGFAETTIDEIADRAFLSPSTFFRYFGDKEEVLFAGVRELREVLVSMLATELAEHPPWEAVKRSVRVTTRTYVEHDPALAARSLHLWVTEPALRARYLEVADSWEQAIVETVTASQKPNRANGAYAAALAVAAVGAFRIAIEQFTTNGLDLVEHFDSVLELIGRGLQTKPAKMA